MNPRCSSLVLAALAIAGCRAESKAPDGRHHEPGGGFSLVAPVGWVVREVPGFKYRFLFGPPIGDFAPNINVVDERFPGSAREYTQAGLAAAERMFPRFQVHAKDEFALDNGVDAVRARLTNEQNGRELDQTMYFVVQAGRAFVITCSKQASDSRDFSAAFDECARSFRVER